MPSVPGPPLVGGPYRAVRVRPGHTVVCLIRGEVEVHGVTEGARSTADGPLAWPYVEPCPGTGRLTLLLLGDLARAVRVESVQAVCHYWGVSRYTVRRWRRALGVGVLNASRRHRRGHSPIVTAWCLERCIRGFHGPLRATEGGTRSGPFRDPPGSRSGLVPQGLPSRSRSFQIANEHHSLGATRLAIASRHSGTDRPPMLD